MLQGMAKKSGGFGCLGILVAGVMVFAGFAIYGAVSSEPGANDDFIATQQCEKAVKEQLKAPATAQFNSSAEGGGPWTVIGTVDAENSFGANVRSDFQCTVRISGDTANVTVDYLG